MVSWGRSTSGKGASSGRRSLPHRGPPAPVADRTHHSPGRPAGRCRPADREDPAFAGALTGYETWAHENCGYQNIDLAGTDHAFAGTPGTLDAGPISLLLTNESTEGEFHVALLARANDPAMTVEEFQALSFEQLGSAVELLPGAAAAPPGATGGMLADLEPGTYFVLCPVGDEGEVPHHLQGMINRVTVA